MLNFLATSEFLINNGLFLSLGLGVLGLLVAVWLIARIKALSDGNDAMREVAGAIQEGAKAYLGRQVKTISAISVILFILLFAWKKSPAVPVGFLTGAVCSLISGYVGMRGGGADERAHDAGGE